METYVFVIRDVSVPVFGIITNEIISKFLCAVSPLRALREDKEFYI